MIFGLENSTPERRHQPERRHAARALHDQEMRLRCAAQEVGFGTFELDCIGGQVRWSHELKGIAGLPQDDAPLSLSQMQEMIHPFDRERVMSKLLVALDPQGNGEFNDDYRLLRPDSALLWVRAKSRTSSLAKAGINVRWEPPV